MNIIQGGIKVFAPATIANVGCGFDVLGVAVHGLGDEIVIRPSEGKGLSISKITGDKGSLSKDITKNTAGIAAQAVLEHLGVDMGLEMEIRKKMPSGVGLGSSAASAVAGAMAINEIFKRPLTKRELLPFAMKGNPAANNVAASLLGGMMLIRDKSSLDVHRLYVPKGLFMVILTPNKAGLENERAILNETITLKQHTEQSANLASLVVALVNSDLGLIKRSLQDVIIEPQRAQLVPHFYEVKKAALQNGALGCSISGRGASIFAWCKNSLDAEIVGNAMQLEWTNRKVESKLNLSSVNTEGAIKC